MRKKGNLEGDVIKGLLLKLKEEFSKITFLSATLEKNVSKLNDSTDMLHKLAYLDSLTNLPNRTSFNACLKEILENNKENKIGVIFIDIDKFKQINDMLGHEQGDILLSLVGDRFKNLVDANTKVFRLGGDEFVVVKWGSGELDMGETIDKALKLLSEDFSLLGGIYKITGSLGVSIYPNDGEDISEIIKNADMAMYKSKEKGGGLAQYFSIDIREEFFYRIKMEQGIRKAFNNKELELYYQPQISAKTNKIVSFEVLLRWNSTEYGKIKADEFIKIAEESTLILDIDRYVLKRSCIQNKKWQNEGYEKIPVSVNISPKTFIEGEIVNAVKGALEESGLEGKYLTIEITEGSLIKDYNKVIKMLHELMAIGVNVSIDDFGRGYSSLSQLINLPISEVKIDGEFIYGIRDDIKKQMVVRLIISLAHQLNLNVVAEGVEKQEEMDFLKSLNCDIMQGYYFSKALSGEEGVKLLKENNIINV
ncbi:MAG: putative bifunctional diguanylate cyclase/phosphodiesterase [Clostridium sp.]